MADFLLEGLPAHLREERLADICQVDPAVARETLRMFSGDMQRALTSLLNSHNEDRSLDELQELNELQELGGISFEGARELLLSCNGNVEQAKAKILEMLGIAEEYSGILKHPTKEQTCPVCFESCPPAQLVQLQQCAHIFCLECLQGWIRAESANSCSGSIKCPLSASCNCSLAHVELKELLSNDEELFRKIDRQALELLSASDSSMYLCPSPDCSYIVSWDAESGGSARTTCPLCFVERCLACGTSPYHEGQSCAEHLQTLRDMQQASSNGCSELEAQEAATRAYLERSGMRVCKRCHSGVVKSSGCDKMKCRCGYRFCYQCDAENARCKCTPQSHGFWDNITSTGDFTNLR